MVKLNSVEWWKKVGEACQKDEKYLQYCKETAKPMSFKIKMDVVDDKPIILTFEYGKMIDVHEASPGEECKLAVRKTYNTLSRIIKKEITLIDASTHKLCEVQGMVTLLQYAKPLVHMLEVVAPNIPCEF